MAKGNLFQGMARGVVGDVVFSRLDGQQVSRVRNRNPKNPRTNAQLYQRAIMATVMLMYSKGKAIFDHSFEGKSVGSGCQRRFMELNALKLRSAVANDINNNVALNDQKGRVVAPKSKYAVPFSYVLSEGSYDNVVTDPNGKFTTMPTTGEKCNAYCERIGLIAGDYYTLVMLNVDTDEPVFEVAGESSLMAKQYESQFGFIRFKVKASALTDTETVVTSSTLISKFFEIDAYEGVEDIDFSSATINDGLLATTAFWAAGDIASGMIRSRFDMDLRSNTKLDVSGMDWNFNGLASEFALAAWKQGTASVGDSELILEGGGNF